MLWGNRSLLEGSLLADDFFVLLELRNTGDELIDLGENMDIVCNTPLVLSREDVLHVVFELLAADRTDHVVSSRLWLLDAGRVLFQLGLFPIH